MKRIVRRGLHESYEEDYMNELESDNESYPLRSKDTQYVVHNIDTLTHSLTGDG